MTTDTTTPNDIERAVLDLYPEIREWDVDLEVLRDPETASWMVKLVHDSHALSTHLEPEDVEQCLKRESCPNLSLQVTRFIDQFCKSDGACESVGAKC